MEYIIQQQIPFFFYLKDFIQNKYNCKMYKLQDIRFFKKCDLLSDKVIHRGPLLIRPNKMNGDWKR